MKIKKVEKKETTKIYGIRLTAKEVKRLLKVTGATTASKAVKHLINQIEEET